MPVFNGSEWNDFLSGFPDAHILQTSAWGDLKSEFGWEVERVVAGTGDRQIGAQVLFRRLPLGFQLAYIPKGPVGAACRPGGAGHAACLQAWGPLLEEVDALCRRRRAVLLKMEPDLWHANGGQLRAGGEPPAGFRHSRHSVQPLRTLAIDIQGDEDRIMSRMKQKTRYNIRLARKRGVVVRPSEDVETFYRLMEVTADRDAFGVHEREYYRRAYEMFHPQGQCELLVAEYDAEPLAALMVFARGRRAWYFYGASSNQHRDKMPTYLLQWEAIRWARLQGCREYDLWGVPDADEESLEASFTERRGGLWGVYRFKRGFGGDLRRSLGPWDRVYRPLLYAFYRMLAGRVSAG